MFAAWLVTSAALNGSGLMINPYLAVAVMFIVGIAIGWFNGLLIVYLGLNAFIATLAMFTYGAIILLSLILARLTSGKAYRSD
jgi:ribose/xylose/arabinose/galactoside ABC-type transport system permease subunit